MVAKYSKFFRIGMAISWLGSVAFAIPLFIIATKDQDGAMIWLFCLFYLLPTGYLMAKISFFSIEIGDEKIVVKSFLSNGEFPLKDFDGFYIVQKGLTKYLTIFFHNQNYIVLLDSISNKEEFVQKLVEANQHTKEFGYHGIIIKDLFQTISYTFSFPVVLSIIFFATDLHNAVPVVFIFLFLAQIIFFSAWGLFSIYPILYVPKYRIKLDETVTIFPSDAPPFPLTSFYISEQRDNMGNLKSFTIEYGDKQLRVRNDIQNFDYLYEELKKRSNQGAKINPSLKAPIA